MSVHAPDPDAGSGPEPTPPDTNVAAAVEARGLRCTLGGSEILRGLDFDVATGTITGFLGPNGAGKTTTLRTLLGLVRLDAGEARLLGRDVPSGLAALRGAVGAIIDTPAVYPALSGRRNVRVLADLAGGRDAVGAPIDARRIDEVLDLVGLLEVAGRTAATYSAGMRMRLAIAGALVTRPKLAILDEPGNGLDPAGQRRLREVLRDLRDAGTTLLVSSHLLTEVAEVCDAVTVMARGRRVAAGPTAEILVDHRPRTYVDAGPGTRTAVRAALGAAPGVDGVEDAPDHPDALLVSVADPALVAQALAGSGVWVRELRPHRASLEELFFELTEEQPGAEDGTAAAP